MASPLAEAIIAIGADDSAFRRQWSMFRSYLEAQVNMVSKMVGAIVLPHLFGAQGGALDLSLAKLKNSLNIFNTGGLRNVGMEMELLRQEALRIGTSSMFSAQQVVDAMAQMAQSGLGTADVLKTIPAITDLATASGIDLAKAATITRQVMTEWGVGANEVAKITDTLAVASNMGAGTVENLGRALAYASREGRAAGQSFSEVLAEIIASGRAGAVTNRAGREAATLYSNLAQVVGRPANLARAGLTQEDFVTTSGRLKSLTDIINTLQAAGTRMGLAPVGLTQMLNMGEGIGLNRQALQAVHGLLQQGSADLLQFWTMLNNVDGAGRRLAGSVESSLGGAITILRKSLTTFFEDMGTRLPLFAAGVGLISGAIRWFVGLSDGAKNAVGSVAELWFGLVAFQTLLPRLISVFIAFFSVLATPARFALAAIDLVTGGIRSLFGYVTGAIGGAFSLIGRIATPILEGVWGFAQGLAGALLAAFNLIGGIIATVLGAIPTIGGIGTGIVQIFTSLTGVITNLFSGIGSLLSGLATSVFTVFRSIATAIYDVFSSVMGAVTSILTSGFRIATMLITGGLVGYALLLVAGITSGMKRQDELGAQIRATWGSLLNVLGDILRQVLGIVEASDFWTTIQQIGLNILTNIRDFVEANRLTIIAWGRAFVLAFLEVMRVGGMVIGWLGSNIGAFFQAAGDWFTRNSEAIRGWAVAFLAAVMTVSDYVSTFFDNLVGRWDVIWAEARSIFSSFVAWLGTAVQFVGGFVNGVFMAIGVNIMRIIGGVITGLAGFVPNAIGAMATNAANMFINSVIASVSSLPPAVLGALSGMFGSGVGVIAGMAPRPMVPLAGGPAPLAPDLISVITAGVSGGIAATGGMTPGGLMGPAGLGGIGTRISGLFTGLFTGTRSWADTLTEAGGILTRVLAFGAGLLGGAPGRPGGPIPGAPAEGGLMPGGKAEFVGITDLYKKIQEGLGGPNWAQLTAAATGRAADTLDRIEGALGRLRPEEGVRGAGPGIEMVA